MSTPIPSSDEIKAGQKAYQRMVAFDRNRYGFINGAFICLFVGFMIYSLIKEGHTTSAVFWTILFAGGVLQFQQQKRKYQRDLAYLAQLKQKYGPEIYAEVARPPRSVYYYLFQKRYWPANRRPLSVTLP